MKRKTPFPNAVSPMLATLGKMPDREQDYSFEFKWDGYRSIFLWDGKRIRLSSRNLLDFTPRFPELHGLSGMLRKPVILDGEVVAPGKGGAPSFGLLQKRAGASDARAIERMRAAVPVVYMIFDLLYFDDDFTTFLPYERRRELLDSLKLDGESWKTPVYRVGDGTEMLQVAEKHGFEGVVGKRLGSIYETGKRSPDWIKIRLFKRQELVVGGWTPGEGAFQNTLGSILVGYYEGPKRFRYAGHVGTGFSGKQRDEIKAQLEKIEMAKSPFLDPVGRRDVHFAKPRFVVEVEFTEWTDDQKLRHPSFKGFRIDKKPEEVILEKPAIG